MATVSADTPKFEPVMVTSVPDGPVEGVKPAMTGAAGGRTVTEQFALKVPAVTTRGAELLLPTLVLTMRLPVVAPTGIESNILIPSELVYGSVAVVVLFVPRNATAPEEPKFAPRITIGVPTEP